MATRAQVRRIALSFPETEEAKERFAFSVRNKGKLKGFAWVWMERITPKKPRVPNPEVLAVRVANLVDKDLMISIAPPLPISHAKAHIPPRSCASCPVEKARDEDVHRRAASE